MSDKFIVFILEVVVKSFDDVRPLQARDMQQAMILDELSYFDVGYQLCEMDSLFLASQDTLWGIFADDVLLGYCSVSIHIVDEKFSKVCTGDSFTTKFHIKLFDKYLWLDDLFINPQYRGNDLGHQFLSCVLNFCQQKENLPVFLFCQYDPGDITAEYYEKAGFVNLSEFDSMCYMVKPPLNHLIFSSLT